MQKVLVKKLTRDWVVEKLPSRPENANKGTFGKILVFAGSENYPGAAYLVCAAAYRAGAGLVTLVTELSVKKIISRRLAEVTFLSYKEAIVNLGEYDVLLIGPGLGQSSQVVEFVNKLLDIDSSQAVIDGDGLNILSKAGEWWRRLKGEIILTPHPGEMARLTGLTIQKIQSDRIHVAQYFAKKWKKIIVLKGANTVIAPPEGGVLLSPFANPVLATAGTGDVLAGIIVGILAQGLKPFDAAGVGVYIHGQAGEMLREKLGSAGALASDLLPVLPRVLKLLKK